MLLAILQVVVRISPVGAGYGYITLSSVTGIKSRSSIRACISGWYSAGNHLFRGELQSVRSLIWSLRDVPGMGSPVRFHWMIRSAMSMWAALCSFWMSRGVSSVPLSQGRDSDTLRDSETIQMSHFLVCKMPREGTGMQKAQSQPTLKHPHPKTKVEIDILLENSRIRNIISCTYAEKWNSFTYIYTKFQR